MANFDAPSKIELDVALDGVYYAIINVADKRWRLGAITPAWRSELARVPVKPAVGDLDALAARGVWLASERDAPPIGAVCCGLGSSWAGMGKGLYANFPVARAAMDELAALAGWDLLALMNDPSPKSINETRRQIPYLFMLEYAQWKQLTSLGFRPDLLCGHSLGELIALCFSGIYSPASVWYLLDTRAEHMAELEARSTKQSGMLAISADYSVVLETLATCPSVVVSNANTPNQFVLSGPRETLAEVRKTLRKRRVPAFMLNVDLAFHNPAMRVLRDLSYRRLRSLETRPPLVPLLSCVTADIYPSEGDKICEAITDLDENAVLWSKCAGVMRDRFGARRFVELGPGETLRGLLRENDETLDCVSCDRKNREIEAMREACAKLFAAGYLKAEAITARKSERGFEPETIVAEALGGAPEPAPASLDREDKIILDLLAKASGVPASSIRLDWDLRHDLVLRSSNFPWLAQEAERALQKSVSLENLFTVTTVGDLTRFLKGGEAGETATLRENDELDLFARVRAPLSRYVVKNGAFFPEPLDPGRPSYFLKRGARVAAVSLDRKITGLWRSLCPLDLSLAIFADKTEETFGDARVFVYPREALRNPASAIVALEEFKKAGGIDAVLLDINDVGVPVAAVAEWAAAQGARAIFTDRSEDGNVDEALAKIREAREAFGAKNSRGIIWSDNAGDRRSPNALESADLFALEITRGGAEIVLWQRREENPPFYDPSSVTFGDFFPDPVEQAGAGYFKGIKQFSRFATPALSANGAGTNAPEREKGFAGAPGLSPGLVIGSLLSAASACLPWLTIVGVSDARIFVLPALPDGVTRECKLIAKAGFWMPQYGVPTRLCRVKADILTLEANGRRKGATAPLAGCECQMAARAPAIGPLWLSEADTTPTSLADTYYEAEALGEEWRFIEGLAEEKTRGQPAFWRAKTLLPDNGVYAIASAGFNRYNNLLYALDAIFQAAKMILGLDGQKRFSSRLMANWRFRSAGFIRFNFKNDASERNLILDLRESWRDADLARFDAQVMSGDGAPLVTVTHLEFDGIATFKSAK